MNIGYLILIPLVCLCALIVCSIAKDIIKLIKVIKEKPSDTYKETFMTKKKLITLNRELQEKLDESEKNYKSLYECYMENDKRVSEYKDQYEKKIAALEDFINKDAMFFLKLGDLIEERVNESDET